MFASAHFGRISGFVHTTVFLSPMFTSIPTTVVDEYAWEFVPNLEIYKQFVWHFVWWTSWPMNNHQNCIFSCRGINVQLKLTMKDLGHPLVTPHSSSKSALDCSIHKYHKSCINFHSYLKTDLPESILPPFPQKSANLFPLATDATGTDGRRVGEDVRLQAIPDAACRRSRWWRVDGGELLIVGKPEISIIC